MKYKKQIATSALALSLLVIGSSVYAAVPQDISVKSVQPSQQKINKSVKSKKDNIVIGTISAISDTGFTVETKNLKTKAVSSIEVKTGSSTIYRKNGIVIKSSDLTIGEKAIISGSLDKKTSIIIANKVGINTVVSKTSVKK